MYGSSLAISDKPIPPATNAGGTNPNLKSFLQDFKELGAENEKVEYQLLQLADEQLNDAMTKFGKNSHDAAHAKLKKLVKLGEKCGSTKSNELLRFSVYRIRAMGYYINKDWPQVVRFMNSAVSKCPIRNGNPVSGLADALIVLTEAYSELNRLEDALNSAKMAVEVSHKRLEDLKSRNPSRQADNLTDNIIATSKIKDFHDNIGPNLNSLTSLALSYFTLAIQLEKSALGSMAIEWHERAVQTAIKYKLDPFITTSLKDAYENSVKKYPRPSSSVPEEDDNDDTAVPLYQVDKQISKSLPVLPRMNHEDNISLSATTITHSPTDPSLRIQRAWEPSSPSPTNTSPITNKLRMSAEDGGGIDPAPRSRHNQKQNKLSASPTTNAKSTGPPSSHKKQIAAIKIQCFGRSIIAKGRVTNLKKHQQYLRKKKQQQIAIKKIIRWFRNRIIVMKKRRRSIHERSVLKKSLTPSSEKNSANDSSSILSVTKQVVKVQSQIRGVLGRIKAVQKAREEVMESRKKIDLMKSGFVTALEKEREIINVELRELIKKSKDENIRFLKEKKELEEECQLKIDMIKSENNIKNSELELKILQIEQKRNEEKDTHEDTLHTLREKYKKDLERELYEQKCHLQLEYETGLSVEKELNRAKLLSVQNLLTTKTELYENLLITMKETETNLLALQFTDGVCVEAKTRLGKKWYRAIIVKCRTMGLYDIEYEDNEVEKYVDLEDIRLYTAASPDPESSDKFRMDASVEARCNGGAVWYPGHVLKVRTNGTLDVEYSDGKQECSIPRELVRLPVIQPRPNKHPNTLPYVVGQEVEMRYPVGTAYTLGVVKRSRPGALYDIQLKFDNSMEIGVHAQYIRSTNTDDMIAIDSKALHLEIANKFTPIHAEYKIDDNVDIRFDITNNLWQSCTVKQVYSATYDVVLPNGNQLSNIGPPNIRKNKKVEGDDMDSNNGRRDSCSKLPPPLTRSKSLYLSGISNNIPRFRKSTAFTDDFITSNLLMDYQKFKEEVSKKSLDNSMNNFDVNSPASKGQGGNSSSNPNSPGKRVTIHSLSGAFNHQDNAMKKGTDSREDVWELRESNHNAATVMQRVYRGYVTRQAVAILKQERVDFLRNQASSNAKLQRVRCEQEMHQEIRRQQELMNQRKLEREQAYVDYQNSMVIPIQSLVRQYLAKCHIVPLRYERHRQVSATTIQKHIRGMISRIKAKQAKVIYLREFSLSQRQIQLDEREQQLQEMYIQLLSKAREEIRRMQISKIGNANARTIQLFVRKYQAKKKVQSLRLLRKLYLAATVIQALIRGVMTRTRIRKERLLKLHIKNTIKIQRFYRNSICRFEYNKKCAEKHRKEAEKREKHRLQRLKRHLDKQREMQLMCEEELYNRRLNYQIMKEDFIIEQRRKNEEWIRLENERERLLALQQNQEVERQQLMKEELSRHKESLEYQCKQQMLKELEQKTQLRYQELQRQNEVELQDRYLQLQQKQKHLDELESQSSLRENILKRLHDELIVEIFNEVNKRKEMDAKLAKYYSNQSKEKKKLEAEKQLKIKQDLLHKRQSYNAIKIQKVYRGRLGRKKIIHHKSNLSKQIADDKNRHMKLMALKEYEARLQMFAEDLLSRTSFGSKPTGTPLAPSTATGTLTNAELHKLKEQHTQMSNKIIGLENELHISKQVVDSMEELSLLFKVDHIERGIQADLNVTPIIPITTTTTYQQHYLDPVTEEEEEEDSSNHRQQKQEQQHHQAARNIQRHVRGKQARKTVTKKLQSSRQSHAKNAIERLLVTADQEIIEDKLDSEIVRLEALYLEQRRYETIFKQANGAIQFQRIIRGFLARRKYRSLYDEYCYEMKLRKIYASTKLQRLVRGFLARRKVKKLKAKKRIELQNEHERKRQLQLQLQRQKEEEDALAKIVQRQQILAKMATKIQSLIRGVLSRKKSKHVKLIKSPRSLLTSSPNRVYPLRTGTTPSTKSLHDHIQNHLKNIPMLCIAALTIRGQFSFTATGYLDGYEEDEVPDENSIGQSIISSSILSTGNHDSASIVDIDSTVINTGNNSISGGVEVYNNSQLLSANNSHIEYEAYINQQQQQGQQHQSQPLHPLLFSYHYKIHTNERRETFIIPLRDENTCSNISVQLHCHDIEEPHALFIYGDEIIKMAQEKSWTEISLDTEDEFMKIHIELGGSVLFLGMIGKALVNLWDIHFAYTVQRLLLRAQYEDAIHNFIDNIILLKRKRNSNIYEYIFEFERFPLSQQSKKGECHRLAKSLFQELQNLQNIAKKEFEIYTRQMNQTILRINNAIGDWQLHPLFIKQTHLLSNPHDITETVADTLEKLSNDLLAMMTTNCMRIVDPTTASSSSPPTLEGIFDSSTTNQRKSNSPTRKASSRSVSPSRTSSVISIIRLTDSNVDNEPGISSQSLWQESFPTIIQSFSDFFEDIRVTSVTDKSFLDSLSTCCHTIVGLNMFKVAGFKWKDWREDKVNWERSIQQQQQQQSGNHHSKDSKTLLQMNTPSNSFRRTSMPNTAITIKKAITTIINELENTISEEDYDIFQSHFSSLENSTINNVDHYNKIGRPIIEEKELVDGDVGVMGNDLILSSLKELVKLKM